MAGPTEVTFRSDAFNTRETKEHFLNPHNFGDDVCEWMVSECVRQGLLPDAVAPEQEDFGWYFEFWAGSKRHYFVVGYQPEPTGPGRWVGWLERASLLPSLFGARRFVDPRARVLVDRVLLSHPRIKDITWS